MLNLEEGFGGLVRQLRGGRKAQELCEEIEAFARTIGQRTTFDRNTLGLIERGKTQRPRSKTVALLCKFFHTDGKLTSSEDIVYL